MARRAKRRRAASGAQQVMPRAQIEDGVHVLRGQRVMLDRDLAAFHGVSTRCPNEPVKRNAARFPADFAFVWTAEEWGDLKSQIATSSSGWGGRRKRLTAFTEHGALMAPGIPASETAVAVSILVVRAFVRLRHIWAADADLARRLEKLEQEFVDKTAEHAAHLRQIYEWLHELMNPPEPPKKGRIGFVTDAEPSVRALPPRTGRPQARRRTS